VLVGAREVSQREWRDKVSALTADPRHPSHPFRGKNVFFFSFFFFFFFLLSLFAYLIRCASGSGVWRSGQRGSNHCAHGHVARCGAALYARDAAASAG
jgi:hypothetical protein